MKIFPASDIHAIDEATIEREAISSLDLMERAANALAEAIMSRWNTDTSFIVFAGPGNNGGDALAVSRLMAEKGYKLSVYLFNVRGELSADCEANKEFLNDVEGVEMNEVTTSFVPPQLTAEHVVIDGLFGVGLNRPLSGGFASLVRFINSSEATVVSIDMPSGLLGEDNTGNNTSNIIRADLTLSFQTPKLAFFFPENEQFLGEWELLDIKLDEETLEYTPTHFETVEPEDLLYKIKPRTRFQHKGNFGKGLLIAGKRGMAGAALLATRACLHSGIGLLTVHTAACNNIILQLGAPEAMTEPDLCETHVSQVADTSRYKAIGMGPGLGMHQDTVIAVKEVIESATTPIVLDADALNIIGEHKDLLEQLPQGCIMTPHFGEMDRLIGRSMSNSYDRLMETINMAKKYHLVIVLKSAYTFIINQEGHCYINMCGNPGMATGGMGDALTGIILSLLAQDYDSETAALLGVYVHSIAGDMAEHQLGETAMITSDVIAQLSHVWKKIE